MKTLPTLFITMKYLGCIYIFLCSLAVAAQRPSAPAPVNSSPPVREEAAVNDLRNALNRISGGRIPLDVELSGTLTINGVNGPIAPRQIEIVCKGNRKVRVELQLETGKNTYVLNGGQASIVTAAGERRTLHPINTVSQLAEYLPVLILSEANDSRLLAKPQGAGNFNGVPIQSYELWPVATSDPNRIVNVSQPPPLLVSINPLTGQILKLERVQYSEDAKFSHKTEIVFSDYRFIDGIAVPMKQERFLDGRLSSTLHLANAKFNSGHQDSEFEAAH